MLLGWVDTTPAELNDAGDVATVNTPAAFECDLHRGESDYEAARLNEAVGERPPTLLVTRWKLRPGANPRALRARIDRAVKTAPPRKPQKPEPGAGAGDEKSAPGEVGRVTVPKGANPLADFGFGPAVPKKAEEKRAKPAPAPAPAVEDSESDDTDGSGPGGSDESSSSSSDDENRDEAANVVDRRTKSEDQNQNQNCQNQNGAAGVVVRGDAVRVEEEDEFDGAER